MTRTNKYLATIVIFGLASTVCMAQDDDGPVGFSYATYYVFDVSTQGDMDTVIEANEKAVFDRWVKDGKLLAWGYLSHYTGGRWRRVQYHSSATLAEALNNQAAIFTEIYSDNQAGGQARSEACAAHDDYVWAIQQGSPPGTDRGAVSYSSYYVCDINGQERADEIWAEANAPYLDQLKEEGKISAWGWLSHIIGGKYRRLQTITGADYASVVQANAGLAQFADDNHPELGAEFNDICGSHTDYLWDIVHEAP